MSVVEINNLTKDYEIGFLRKRKVRALDGLTLSVEGGQIFGFLGANGAGKTTTLKLLMRLIFPTAGGARILGQDFQNVSVHQRIGYLPENPYFYDYLTALEYLDFVGRLFRMPRHPIACRAALEIATASAPRASALTKSVCVRSPPVITSVTCDPA